MLVLCQVHISAGKGGEIMQLACRKGNMSGGGYSGVAVDTTRISSHAVSRTGFLDEQLCMYVGMYLTGSGETSRGLGKQEREERR